MPCEHYKDALIEVAASGATPSGELRAHLDACASCRAALDEEQTLFAAIDSGLHGAANTEVPPSLLPTVRVAIDEVAALRLRWVQRLVFASAGAALAFVVFLMAWLNRPTPANTAKQRPGVPEANPEKISPEATQVATVRANHSYAARNSTNRHSAASSNPEVLVPPDEREAFAQLVAVLNEHSDVAASLLPKVREKKDGLPTVDPLQIPDIKIKPLNGSEGEAQDGGVTEH